MSTRKTEKRESFERNLGWVATVVCSPERGLTPRHYWLTDDEIPIDRAPGPDGDAILIEDQAISRGRVRLQRTVPGVYRITDSGARNPTRVNGRTIDTSLLDANYVIRVGNSLIVLDRSDAARSFRRRIPSDSPILSLLDSLAMHHSTEAGMFAAAVAFVDLDLPSVAVTCEHALETRIVAEWFAERWETPLVAFDAAVADLATQVAEVPEGTAVLIERVEGAPPPVLASIADVLRSRITTSPPSPVVFSTTIRERRMRPALVERLFSFNAMATLRVPPLGDRRSDVIEGIVSQLRRAGNIGRIDLPVPVCERLVCYDWPGGVAELRREASRLRAIIRSGEPVDESLLSGELRAIVVETDDSGPPELALEPILRLMDESGGKMSVVARRFGYSRSYFYHVLWEHEVRAAWKDRNRQR